MIEHLTLKGHAMTCLSSQIDIMRIYEFANYENSKIPMFLYIINIQICIENSISDAKPNDLKQFVVISETLPLPPPRMCKVL